MTPQAAAFLSAAERALSKAHRVLAIDISDEAARHAYYAQFHAAQALIFERTSKVARTHKGVDAQFHKLANAEPALQPELGSQLSAAYYFKMVADYDTGTAPPITSDQALEAIANAERYIAAIRQVLAPPPP